MKLYSIHNQNPLLSSSCHLDRALNVKIGVECQIFVTVHLWKFKFLQSLLGDNNATYFWSEIISTLTAAEFYNLGVHSRYYKGALTQKRSFLVICTTFKSDFHKNHNKHSTLNSSFNPLSKWHEPDIKFVKSNTIRKTNYCVLVLAFVCNFFLHRIKSKNTTIKNFQISA